METYNGHTLQGVNDAHTVKISSSLLDGTDPYELIFYGVTLAFFAYVLLERRSLRESGIRDAQAISWRAYATLLVTGPLLLVCFMLIRQYFHLLYSIKFGIFGAFIIQGLISLFFILRSAPNFIDETGVKLTLKTVFLVVVSTITVGGILFFLSDIFLFGGYFTKMF